MSKISVLGLYKYDQSLFDNLQLPEGFTADDRTTLINNLLMECAEFECTYPNFDFCKAAIGFWSAARLSVWQKLYASTMFVYNPIWNKDGTITETRTKEYTGEKSGTVESEKEYADEKSASVASSKESEASKEDMTTDTRLAGGNLDSTTENKTAGFNSNDYVKKDTQIVDQTWDETDTHTIRHIITDTGSETGSTTESGTTSSSESGSTTESGSTSGTESEEYVRTEQGNIGLTSTQQLIKEEREVAQFEIDDFIIKDFKKQFCILVY